MRKNWWAIKHDGHRTPLYRVWHSMIQRCESPADQNYPRYGGRGILVCEEWHKFSTFRSWAESSGYAKGLYIDRRDNDGNYEPSNCRWVTSAVSAFNRPTTVNNIAVIAAVKDLSHDRLLTSKLLGALFAIDPRRVSEWRDGKKFSWVTPQIMFEDYDGGTRSTIKTS